MPSAIYQLVSLGNQLNIGVAGSRYLTLSAVGKQNVANAPYCIPNEMICGELGRFLRLPVPPLGVVKSAGGECWIASLNFNLVGNDLPPVNPAQCVRLLPSLSAGVLMFDIWIANLDRNQRNLSVDTLATPPQMSIYDHGIALLGFGKDKGVERLAEREGRLGISWESFQEPTKSGRARHCLLDVIATDDHFDFWLKRIEVTPDFLIDEICNDARPYGLTLQEADAAARFLKNRRDTIRNIIMNNRIEFRAIKQWNLPL